MRAIALPILLLVALGMAVGACTSVERQPDVGAPASSVVEPGVGVGTAAPAVRRRFCQPQPWCVWGPIRGPSYR
jgi:hypothetical protein